MTMGGIFAQADVNDDEEVGVGFAEEADSGDDGAVLVVGCGAEGVFCVGSERDAEENDGAEAFGYEGADEFDDFVQAESVLVWEGRDGGDFFRVVGQEERIDEHCLE